MAPATDHIAERIIASASFGQSQTYANLLRYLVEKTEREEVPKEVDIAHDVFGKTDFDPSESTLVRVYVYNLRKKLKAYYAAEGAEDAERLRIPKGGYRVTTESRLFAPVAPAQPIPPAPAPRAQTHRRLPAYLLFLLVGGILGALSVWWLRRPPPANPLLAGIVDNQRPDLLVIGDLFVYRQYDSLTGHYRSIRNARVNSTADFARLRDRYGSTTDSLAPRGYTFLISNAGNWVQALTREYTRREVDFSLRLASQLSADDLRRHDLIAVGMTKTLGPLRALFSASHLDYVEYDTYRLTDAAGRQTTFEPRGSSAGRHTDYGLVARFPGPGGVGTVLLCTGLWDSATSHALEMVTQARLRSELEDRIQQTLGELPNYYEVFFQLDGREQTGLDYEILHVATLDDVAVDW